jgi:antagonist of KipI
MSLVFLTSGLLTTIQDAGRNGYRRFGINPNGAMDRAAARLINILLGNDGNEGVLEMHFPAPKIMFEEDAAISLGGADFGARLDETEVENWRPILVNRGSVLSFPRKISGARMYLAVKGGFAVQKWLGSVSTNLRAKIGGFQGRSLRKGDVLFFKKTVEARKTKTNYKISRSLIPPYSSFPTVRVISGAEIEYLSAKSRRDFQSKNFAVRHESDRMGFRLEGESLNSEKKLELISSAVDFGTVQQLPDGQLIILMADHQTSGGYPRVAHIISRDLPLVGQLGAADRLNFKIISIEEAENLIAEYERDLNLLRTACLFKNF